MTNFPALVPTSRRVTQGQYAVKRFTTVSGTGTTRLYGSQPFGSSVELSYDNVSDTSALQIVNCYEAARGGFSALRLPDEVWNGMDRTLSLSLKRDYVWRFSEQPQVTSGTPGRSSVTVRLEGLRDG